LVVLTGFILRTLFMKIVVWTRSDSYSKEASATMHSVLVVSFFNAGILYIIAPWSFAESGAKDGSFFSGLYTDFTSEWFLEIGNLIAETAAIGIFFPVIESVVFYGLRLLKRCID
jgi:hypothetical protein